MTLHCDELFTKNKFLTDLDEQEVSQAIVSGYSAD